MVRFNHQVEMGTCEFQDGSEGLCVEYTKCFPFIQMLANLRRPLPAEIPIIMKEVYLCGKEPQTGLPKICCPRDGLHNPNFLEMEKLTEGTTTTTTEIPTTTTKSRPNIITTSTTTTTTTTTSTTTTTTSTTTTTTTTEQPRSFLEHPGMNILSNLATCGRPFVVDSMFRIVGGKKAKLGQFPWLANIGYTNSKKELKFRCGGTLIGLQHVLTAAHCVSSLERGTTVSTIRVGEHDLSNSDRDCSTKTNMCAPIPQDFKAVRIMIHPYYNKPNRFNNDIALIKLHQQVRESDFVSPICLPLPSTFHYNISRSRMEVAGWGATDKLARKFSDVLKHVSVPYVGLEKCKGIYEVQRVRLEDSQICAGGNEGEDSCSGDSGSGLMLESMETGRPYDPRWIQVGIVSFGPWRCASRGVPAVYTNVTAYLPWILDSALL